MNVELLQKGLAAFKADPHANLNNWCHCLGGHIAQIAGYSICEAGYIEPPYMFIRVSDVVARELDIDIYDAEILCCGRATAFDQFAETENRVECTIRRYAQVEPTICTNEMSLYTSISQLQTQFITPLTAEIITNRYLDLEVTPSPIYIGELVGV